MDKEVFETAKSQRMWAGVVALMLVFWGGVSWLGWASRQEQAFNRRSNVVITIEGESLSFKAWCVKLGRSYRSAQSRVERGMSHYDALTKPWRTSPCRVPPDTRGT